MVQEEYIKHIKRQKQLSPSCKTKTAYKPKKETEIENTKAETEIGKGS